VATSAEPTSVILIADGDATARKKLARVFERAGFGTAQASTGQEALDLFRNAPPTAAILEPSLSGVSGYEVCRALRDEFGEAIPIIFVSASRTESYDRVAGLLIGADDYLPKPFAPDELLARVRRLVQRAPSPALPSIPSRLTKRELEVLGLLAEGLAQPEIATRLQISEKTVGSHIERILSKLDVRSRAQAVARAFREDLVEVAWGSPASPAHRSEALTRAAQRT
jgi:DNA-binding NarL/FixJ family response regulator